MAAHGICFDFYYWPKPSQMWQNGSAVAADARLTAKIHEIESFLMEPINSLENGVEEK